MVDLVKQIVDDLVAEVLCRSEEGASGALNRTT